MKLISASQVKIFRDECERAWGFKYILGLREEQDFASSLGTECDDTQLQPYLRDGRPIDYSRQSGYVVQPGLALLPKPKTGNLQVQRWFVMPSPTWLAGDGGEPEHIGFGYQGYLDLWLPDGSILPDAAFDPRQLAPYGGKRELADGTIPPVVTDFKTTGNWRYMKTAEQLKTDVQAQLYAAWAMYWTGARVVDLVWLYLATKGKYQARRSHLRVTADHVAEQFTAIDETAVRMYALRKSKADPLSLTPNTSHCSAYRGCPYQSRCNLSPGQIADARVAGAWARKEPPTMSNVTNTPAPTMSLLERLRAGKAQAGAGATAMVVTPPAAAPAPAAPAPPAPVAAPELTAAGIPVANLPAWATAPVDPRTGSGMPPTVGINPPESNLPPAPPLGSVAIPEPVASPEAATPVAVAASADTAAPAPAKRAGPGRPRKATKDPLGADADAHTTPANVTTNIMQTESVVDLLESFSVTWGKETIWPDRSAGCEVGPFEVTGFVREGETLTQAKERVNAELVAFAEKARVEKALSFKAFLVQTGAAK